MDNVRRSEPPPRSDVAGLFWLGAGLVSACVAVTMTVGAVILWECAPRVFARGIMAAAFLPVVLGVPILGYFSHRLVSQSRRNAELESYAFRDGLTQLLNRGAFTRLVEDKLDEMADISAARGALMIADADHFKAINDRWGHAVGDEALRRIGSALRSVLHRDDVHGRLGGEEFGIFLYGSSPDAARTVAERLRVAILAIELHAENGERVPITASIGAIHFRGALPFATLYNLADRNLYLAKENGRNRVVFEDAKLEVYAEAAA